MPFKYCQCPTLCRSGSCRRSVKIRGYTTLRLYNAVHCEFSLPPKLYYLSYFDITDHQHLLFTHRIRLFTLIYCRFAIVHFGVMTMGAGRRGNRRTSASGETPALGSSLLHKVVRTPGRQYMHHLVRPQCLYIYTSPQPPYRS